MIFIGPFLRTDKGITCSDVGLKDLVDKKACIEAMPYAKSLNPDAAYQGTFSSSMAPKGCYIFDNGMAWFNRHSTGSGRSDTRSICRGGS